MELLKLKFEFEIFFKFFIWLFNFLLIIFGRLLQNLLFFLYSKCHQSRKWLFEFFHLKLKIFFIFFNVLKHFFVLSPINLFYSRLEIINARNCLSIAAEILETFVMFRSQKLNSTSFLSLKLYFFVLKQLFNDISWAIDLWEFELLIDFEWVFKFRFDFLDIIIDKFLICCQDGCVFNIFLAILFDGVMYFFRMPVSHEYISK